MNKTLGIRHIALKVENFTQCLDFYHRVLKMDIDWQPDDENVYLTNGRDNLALHYDSKLEKTSQCRAALTQNSMHYMLRVHFVQFSSSVMSVYFDVFTKYFQIQMF